MYTVEGKYHWENEEKYYWKNKDGKYIPKHELSDLYICNIVMKHGKVWLVENGHVFIVSRFEELNREHKFFKVVGGDSADE